MDFEPKTRKEYYMAIIAGGTPGEDFPVMYDREPTVELVYHKYEETLEAKASDSGYLYTKAISNFVNPADFEETMIVKVNGKNTTYDEESHFWENEDGYGLAHNVDDEKWLIGKLSDTELSGDALNVTIETSWIDVSDEGVLAQPKTNIEKYLAYKADIYDGELPDPKTATEYYIKTWATSKDGGGGGVGTK